MKKKILIIDDDEEICEELSEILRAEGYAVETVLDGLTARALIEKKPYHLLMLDLKIPTITGIELLEFVRKKKLNLKILIVTARPLGRKGLIQQNNILTLDAAEQKLLKKTHGVIKKPFDIVMLLSKIKQLLKTA